MELTYQELEHGVTCIETWYQRPGLASCYLLQQGHSCALIDTGTAHTVPLILELLQRKGIAAGDVKYVIPTHVHLDHAGGSGELMRLLPEARLLIHPFGAKHLIDPAKLEAGAKAVYGEEAFRRHFKALLPVDENRVTQVEDETSVDLEGRRLLFLDTPGHARHHICVWDETSRGFFTGDTFGIAYRELHTDKGPFMLLPSTPIQFDPESWHHTLNRLMSYRPERMYLTHYCSILHPEQLVDDLHDELHAYVQIANTTSTAPDRETRLQQALRSYYLARLRDHGCDLPEQDIDFLLTMDLSLCAQGLEVWLKKQEEETAEG